jgi:hypothetical protein
MGKSFIRHEKTVFRHCSFYSSLFFFIGHEIRFFRHCSFFSSLFFLRRTCITLLVESNLSVARMKLLFFLPWCILFVSDIRMFCVCSLI